jgi:hypothetical protein
MGSVSSVTPKGDMLVALIVPGWTLGCSKEIRDPVSKISDI